MCLTISNQQVLKRSQASKKLLKGTPTGHEKKREKYPFLRDSLSHVHKNKMVVG
jgi:hypothetical protein